MLDTCGEVVRYVPALYLLTWLTYHRMMTRTIELDDELATRMEGHLEEDETLEEFIEELVAIYEQEGRFLQEGI